MALRSTQSDLTLVVRARERERKTEKGQRDGSDQTRLSSICQINSWLLTWPIVAFAIDDICLWCRGGFDLSALPDSFSCVRAGRGADDLSTINNRMTMNRGDFRNENKFNDIRMYVSERADARVSLIRRVCISRCNYFREDSRHPLAADRKINHEYRFA